MPEDTPGEEQPTMLSFTEAAERLVKDRIAPSMTAEGLRRLARDPNSGWPIRPKDYRVVGKTRMLPYDLLAPYMRERLSKRPGRGPAKQPGKKRAAPKPQQQGEPMSTTVDPRLAILSKLNDPPYNATAEKRCVPWDDAVQLLDAYRAAVLREVAAEIDGIDAHPNASGRHADIYKALAHRFRRQADELSEG